MTSRQADFTAFLAEKKLREVDEAIAFIWFFSHQPNRLSLGVEISDIVQAMKSGRLRPSVNVSRLQSRLATSRHLVRGDVPNSFRIRATSDKVLEELYGAYRDLTAIKVKDDVISDEISLGSRRHLEQIRREANGCYERGFYNSSAVMCRRLVECLLIEAMIKEGFESAILDANKEIKGFGDLIALAKSKQYIKLSRSAPDLLTKVKQIGDHAAHSRHGVTRKPDIDGLNPALNQVLSELAAKAGL